MFKLPVLVVLIHMNWLIYLHYNLIDIADVQISLKNLDQEKTLKDVHHPHALVL